MTEPIRISNSEIQTFQACRRKWWLGYYKGFKSREQKHTGPLALGSRVHRALELWYNDQSTPLVTYWNDLIRHDRTLMEAAFRDTTDFDNEADLGRIMLEGYVEWLDNEGVDSDYEIISNEEKLVAPLMNGRVELMGKIDQRVRRRVDGVRLVRDFKTAANFTDLTKMASMNEQFLTYMTLEAMQRDEENRVDGGLITMIKKVKRTASARPPFYDQVEVRFNVFALRNFWAKLHGRLTDMMNVRDALDAGADHHVVAYPRPTRDCTWACEFSTICPMFDDGSAVDQALDTMYQVGDPYGYYETTKIGATE